MDDKITVNVVNFDAAGRGIIPGDPRLQGKLPASFAEVEEVLYDFYIEVEISDGEKSMPLTLCPMIDAKKLRVVAWNWALDGSFYIEDDVTPEQDEYDCLIRFFNQLPDTEGYWKLKDEIEEKLLDEINTGLPRYVQSVA